jgi:hypothetical protein
MAKEQLVSLCCKRQSIYRAQRMSPIPHTVCRSRKYLKNGTTVLYLKVSFGGI